MERKVKIPKLEEGAIVEINGRREFINRVINKGEGFFTLPRGIIIFLLHQKLRK